MNQNPKSRQRLSPEQRRSQLINLAMQVFAKDGLERAGHGDIAKLASVSTATVFNYFPTREDLVEAVLEEIRVHIRTMFNNLGTAKAENAIGVRVMVAGFDQLINTQPDLVKVFLRWSVAFGHDIREAYLNFQEELLDSVSSRLMNAGPDRSDGRIILGSAHMYALMRLDRTSDDVTERFIERLLSVLGE